MLIKHLENLAGSPLNYSWCSRMLSGVLPVLHLLSWLLPACTSPFAFPAEIFSLGAGGEVSVLWPSDVLPAPQSAGQRGLRSTAILLWPCCIAQSCLWAVPGGSCTSLAKSSGEISLWGAQTAPPRLRKQLQFWPCAPRLHPSLGQAAVLGAGHPAALSFP